MYSSDNANDELKEGRETGAAIKARAIEYGYEEKTKAHGVSIRTINGRDPFHIHQLCVKWLSESVFGKTDQGNHDQIHHRQVSKYQIKS